MLLAALRCSVASGRLRGAESEATNNRARHSPRIRHVLLDDLRIRLVQHACAARGLDELRRAFDHAVTLTGLTGFDLAGRRHLEALFGAALGLHFRHFACVLVHRSRAAPDTCADALRILALRGGAPRRGSRS